MCPNFVSFSLAKLEMNKQIILKKGANFFRFNHKISENYDFLPLVLLVYVLTLGDNIE